MDYPAQKALYSYSHEKSRVDFPMEYPPLKLCDKNPMENPQENRSWFCDLLEPHVPGETFLAEAFQHTGEHGPMVLPSVIIFVAEQKQPEQKMMAKQLEQTIFSSRFFFFRMMFRSNYMIIHGYK